MRSGPATRTAFAMREFHGCPSPRSPARFLKTFCNASRKPALMQQRRIRTEVQLHPNRADRSQSRHARPFLRRPQRPGCPQRFHALGTSAACLSTLLTQIRRQLLQNQSCAITGSVTSTPAVRALSRIPNLFAIRNRSAAVRNLWTMRIPCGRSRKTRRKFYVLARPAYFNALPKGLLASNAAQMK